VVTVLGHLGRVTTQVEKLPRLNGAIHYLSLAYDGACSPYLSDRLACIFFGASPWRKKKLNESSRLGVVEIARVVLHASSQPLKQEKTCNSAHEHTPHSNNIIDSILLHGEVVRAKDVSAISCMTK
jgi:hypothetical protein